MEQLPTPVFQYSDLENSKDCVVHAVAESDTTEGLLQTTTTHQLKWLEFLKLIILSLGEDIEKFGLPYTADGNVKR